MYKKLLMMMLTAIVSVLVISDVFAAGRWERGIKVSGWYNRDPYGQLWEWKTGLDMRLIRTSPFSTWANTIRAEYGEKIFLIGTIPQQISPNNGGIATDYKRNITAFVYWNFYLSGGSLLQPFGKNDYTESWLSYGKTFSRYLQGEVGLKETLSGNAFDSWLRAMIVYKKFIGYRTSLKWAGIYNNNLKTTSAYKIESVIDLSYKLARRLEFKINFITAIEPPETGSGSLRIFRKETVELTYDLLYTGGRTY